MGLPSPQHGHFAPGTTLGKYELLATIGSGGMASVILARQHGPMGFEKAVVLKVIHPHLAGDEGVVDMLLDEARVAAQINHHNVVQTYELGEAGGTYYIAMEYLAGESLSQILKTAIAAQQHPTPVIGARIVAEVAEGLHAAHELKGPGGELLGVIHRDVSPGNTVVLYNGGVKVVDFGIAKAAGRVTSTQDGELKGKFGYMSPEQINSEPMDRRADVFSLGVMLWEVLALKRLFVGDSVGATLMQILHGARIPPSKVRPEVPWELDAITLKALAADPKDRYQSAAELKAAIDDAIWQSRCGAAELAAYMAALFPDRIAQREHMLTRVAQAGSTFAPAELDGAGFNADSSSLVLRPPSGAVQQQPEPPPGYPRVFARPAAFPPRAALSEPRTPSRLRVPWIILGAGALAGIVLALAGGGGGDEPAEVVAVADVKVAADVKAAAPVAPVATDTMADLATLAASDDPPAAAPPPPAPSEADELLLEIELEPVAEPSVEPAPVAARPRPAARAPVERPRPTGSPDALYKQGAEAFLRGDAAAAERAFKQALAVQRNHAASHRGLGIVYQKRGDTAKAVEHLRRYVALHPDAKDAAAIRARIDGLRGRP